MNRHTRPWFEGASLVCHSMMRKLNEYATAHAQLGFSFTVPSHPQFTSHPRPEQDRLHCQPTHNTDLFMPIMASIFCRTVSFVHIWCGSVRG